MDVTRKTRWMIGRFGLLATATAAMFVAGCAATPTAAPPARVDIVEAVGFTITEEAHIDGNLRADYERP